jgi:two-component system chemotaxis sensor kinase CheA
MEPLLQIAKNAVTHGIELPGYRTELGKPAEGRLRLSAERHGEWLRLVVEDDGRGVDLEHVRSRAVEQGVLSETEAATLDENQLLNLLFVPGLTTRANANMMAGRGVGLDLAQDIVRRLGGGIRFAVREHGGVRVTVELPQELGLVDIVWLDVEGLRLAVPVTFTGRLYANDAANPAIPLGGCLGLEVTKPPPLVLELAIPGLRPLAIGIDAVGNFEEVTVRPLPPLLANAGPYAGAVLEGDGRLCLVLDAPLVAARAWIYSQ